MGQITHSSFSMTCKDFFVTKLFYMSKEYYDYIRADTQGVMPGPSSSADISQFRLIGKVLQELEGGDDYA